MNAFAVSGKRPVAATPAVLNPRRRSLLQTSALVGLTLAAAASAELLLMAQPASAQASGGAGGIDTLIGGGGGGGALVGRGGEGGGGGSAGPGGPSVETGAGQPGSVSGVEGGGGGGGAGQTFGAGGTGGGAAGGAAPGAAGASSASGGGGGAGGEHGSVNAGLPGAAALGIAGGAGGVATGGNSGNGGGGGAGGFGAVVTGPIAGPAALAGTVTGGAGGAGGDSQQTNSGGGGGGGGGGLGLLFQQSATQVTLNRGVTGGGGGVGGNSTANNLSSGGSGGGGGGGVVFSGAATNIVVDAGVSGGSGANGGSALLGASQGSGGGGGGGGTGLAFGAGGSVAINAAVSGGAGGTAGNDISGVPDNPHGAGGAGINGAGLALTLGAAGTIAGGLSGDGVTRANAVAFTGGTNSISFGAAASGLAGGVDIAAGATAQLNAAAGGTTVANVISGGGGVIQNSANTLTLAGANTYTGATTVNGGTLAVNGSIASSSLTTVNAGGTLGGTGTVGNTNIAGGTLAPGNSIGTLTVQGNLAFTTASTYMVEINPTTSDRTNITGTATLGGARVSAIYAAGSYVAKQYTIVNATGGVSGTFSTLVNTNLPAGFTPTLTYDANNAYLNLRLSFVPPTAPTFGNGLTGNQSNVGIALINSFNVAGGIPLVFGTLTSQGLTQLSGEAAIGTQQTTFNAMDQFLNVMTDPFIGTRGGGAQTGGATGYADEAMAYSSGKGRTTAEREAYEKMSVKAPPRATFAERLWSVWGAGFGGTQKIDGDARVGSADTNARVYGGAAGLDYRLTPDTIVGFALAGGGTNFSIASNLGRGSSDLFQAGAFVRHNVGAAYITAAAAYGWQDVTTDRTVTITGIDRLRGRFDTNALSGRVEGGYRFVSPVVGGIGITPYAAGQSTTIFLPAYAEQTLSGANTFALAYASREVTATRSELGLRTDKSFALETAVLTLRGRAAWAHNFDPNRSINANFQSLPGASFVVNGAAQSRDTALASASAELRWTNNWSVAGTFEGEFSNRTDSYAGKGVLRYQW